MPAVCGGDALVCIEFVVLGIGEFLKDWTTIGILALLLGLLFKERADRQEAREKDYARQLGAFADKRSEEVQGPG